MGLVTVWSKIGHCVVVKVSRVFRPVMMQAGGSSTEEKQKGNYFLSTVLYIDRSLTGKMGFQAPCERS